MRIDVLRPFHKNYFGTSPNAVKTQIWIAVTAYLMVAILHKQFGLPGTLHRTLQLLSIHRFEKTSLHELLTETEFKTPPGYNSKQLLLLDLYQDACEVRCKFVRSASFS